MSRSVSTLSDCCEVSYIGMDSGESYWDLKEDVADALMSRFPSFWQSERWDSNEVQIFLENHLVEVGISMYGYLVSISTREKEDYQGFGRVFARKVHDCLEINFKTLRCIGRASNGEAFFERV